MKIPQKIYPDRITNAIVEVRYTSKIPFEILVGLFFNALDDTYNYINKLNPTSKNQSEPDQIGIHLSSSQFLFYNDKIKIQLQPNSIVFNCIKSYILWSNYLPEIEKVLKQLLTTNGIESFVRIGLRYISEYPNIDLQSCIKFSFSFGMPEIQSKTYSFKSEFEYKGNKIVLNLHNKLPVLKNNSSNNLPDTQQLTLIDIDVIKSDIKFPAQDFQSLISNIDTVHSSEKEIFFKLLNDEFLNTLNPVY